MVVRSHWARPGGIATDAPGRLEGCWASGPRSRCASGRMAWRGGARRALSVGDQRGHPSRDRVRRRLVVRSGLSAVDQAAITARVCGRQGARRRVFPAPQRVRRAGGRGPRRSDENTISRMVQLLREAQPAGRPCSGLSSLRPRLYPLRAGVALIVAVAPPLLFSQPFWGDHGWLMRALQLLVIACPCALVISSR